MYLDEMRYTTYQIKPMVSGKGVGRGVGLEEKR
jgi:hypothetical protein